MSRARLPLLFLVALFLGAAPVFATTVAVGTCKPALKSFSTISAAVSSSPSPSTVLVCPGTYPEQVVISTPLTLQGVSVGNSNQAVITVPGTGLSGVVSIIFGSTFAPQVEVATTAGPVTISNLTVDGSGCASISPGDTLIGIYYGSGSSGTVNEVTVHNAPNSCFEHGIVAENGTPTVKLMTIENSSVHDTVNGTAILVGSNQSPGTLTATIKGNSISNTYSGILQYTGAGPGTVTGNVVAANAVGIGAVGSSVLISGNTVTSPTSISAFGAIFAGGAGDTVTGNKVWNTPFWAIEIGASGVTMKSNLVANALVGIEFGCVTGNTVSGNTINDALTGFNDIPLSTTASGSFFNVPTLRNQDCGFSLRHAPPSAEALAKMVAAPRSN